MHVNRKLLTGAALALSFPLASLPRSAQARWATPKDAESAIEFQNLQYDVHGDGTFSMVVEEKDKILKENARGTKGIVHLVYNSRASTFEVLEAYTINGAKKIPVNRKLIEDKPLASNAEGFDQNNQVMIVFPDVEVGSETYVKYRKVVKEVPFQGFFSESFTYGWGDYEMGGDVVIRSDLKLHYKENDPPGDLKVSHSREDGRYVLRIRQTKPAYYRPIEEDSPILDPAHLPWISVSTAASWSDMAQPVLARYESILNSPLPASYERILEAAKKKKNPIDQMNTVTSMLADAVHYLGDWRPIKGGHIPRPLATIASTRFGDCKDFASSTAAILRRLGMKAHVAWVYRSETPVLYDYEEPVDALFNHAITYVETGGKAYWVDPTNLASFAQGIFPDIIDRPALVLDGDKTRLMRTPAPRSEDAESELTMTKDLTHPDEVRAQAELALKGRQSLLLTGATLNTSAETLKYSIVRAASGGDRIKSWKMDDVDLSSRIAHDTQLKLQYTESAYELKTSAGRGFLLEPPSPVTQFLINTQNRVSDLLVDQPYRHRREIRLPGIHRVGDESLDCEVDSPWLSVSRKLTQLSPEGGVRVLDEIELKKGRVPVSELRSERFAKLQNRLRRCFGSIALVFRD
jgi:hypothetical protein